MDQITPYVIVSPLTDDQVKTINVNQVLASHEPFQNSRSPSLCPHLEAGKHDAIAGVVGLLIATKAIIVCPCCDYVQKSVPSGLLDTLPATSGPLDDSDYPSLLAFMRDADEQLQALLDSDRYYMGLNVLQPNVGQYLKDHLKRIQPKVEALVEAMEGRTFAQLAANIRPEPSVAIGTQIDQAALPSDESHLSTS